MKLRLLTVKVSSVGVFGPSGIISCKNSRSVTKEGGFHLALINRSSCITSRYFPLFSRGMSWVGLKKNRRRNRFVVKKWNKCRYGTGQWFGRKTNVITLSLVLKR